MTIKHLYPNSRPTLDLKFAKDKTLDPRITFTRASSGTYVDENGVIQSAATNAARFDHDPVTNESLGLLVEEARTNLIPRSEELTTGWTLTGATAADNATLSPENEFNGSSLVEDSALSAHVATRRVNGITSGGTYTTSVYIKSNGRPNVQFLVDYAYTSSSYMNIDLSSGTYTALGASANTSLVSYGDGWYRASISAVNTAPGTYIDIKIYLMDSSFNATYQGNGTSGVYVWGFQLEAGSFPTSYIPTPATFTSRASTATYYDANGVIQTAAIDVARDNAYFPDENGVMQPVGLLLEGSGTNLIRWSEDFSNSSWVKSGITINPDQVVAPDGSLTADILTPSTNDGYMRQRFISVTGGSSYVGSIWLRSITGSNVSTKIRFFTNVIATRFITITPEWQRFYVVGTALETGTTEFWLGGNSTFSLGEDIAAWGAQLEAGYFPTSYIPTTSSTVTRAADVSTSSTVTRAADVAQITGSNFSSWYNQSEGSTLISYNAPNAIIDTDYPRLFAFNSGFATDFSGFTFNSTNNSMFASYVTGSSSKLYVSTTLPKNSNGTAALAYQDNNSIAFLNENSSTQGRAAGPMSTILNRLDIGGDSAFPSRILNGHISRITYYPTRLSNAILQNLTT